MRSVVVSTERMSHRVYNTQTYVAEAHTCDILSLRHSFTSHRVVAVVNSSLQVGSNHFDSLQFEHIRHYPCTWSNIAFDGVSQCVHTGSSGQAFRHRIHQFRVYDCYSRDIVRVNAYHLLLGIFVDDNIVDSYFGSCTGSRWERKGRNGLFLSVSYTFQ